MKTRILLTICLLMLFIFSISSRNETQNAFDKETITVWNTPETHELINELILEYGKLNPNLEIKNELLNDQGFTENLNEKAGVIFYSQQSVVAFEDPTLLKMVIGRNVIVPVMNAENPFYPIIEQNGISVKNLRDIIAADKADWNILKEIDSKELLQVYLLNDESVKLALAEFLDLSPKILANVNSKSAKEVVQCVQKDKYAIGFCQLVNLAESDQQEFVENIKLLPIDKNENGRIDYHEKIYGSMYDFERGVWIGKYPQTLIQNIYSVSSGVNPDEEVSEFLSWIVTDGQQFMEYAGLSKLLYNERNSRLEKLYPQQIVLDNVQPQSTKSRTILFITFGILAIIIIMAIVYLKLNKKAIIPLKKFPKHAKILNENVLSFPNGLYFDKSHTWVFMERDGTVKLGIDDFLQSITGDYTGLILKNPGEKIIKNAPALTLVQNGKKINVKSPISGKIKEFNEDLVTNPSILNNSPYSRGWVYTIESSNWLREISFLKMSESYRSWIKNEISRLKDFISGVNHGNVLTAQVIYQEGGELTVNVLQELGPKVWEDFQNEFLD